MSMRVSSKPACRELAGGCLGDFRPGGPQDFIVERAVGSHLYTTDGREFIDYLLGSGPMAVGHSNPRIVDAVLQQVRRGTTYYNVSPQVIELAELVVERVPSVEAVRFVADGSEATFFSLRLARAFTGREFVIKFEGGFHGHHDYALQSVHPPVGSDLRTRPDSDGIPDDVTRTVLIARFNDLASVESLLREHAGQVAAILVEPVQRAIMPHAGFLEGLRRLSDEHGCLVIFDEIVTAFRLDRGGAQARYGVMPDLTTLGKVMGGGLPIAAVGGRSEVMDLLRPGREGSYVYVSGTLNGNPLCAAAGVAALKIMDEEDGYRRLTEAGDKLIARITAIAADLGTPVTVTGPSPFFEIMFGQGPMNDFQDYAAFPADKRTAFALEMTGHGVYMRPNAKVYVSIAHSDDDIDQTGEAARKSILALQRRGVLE